ncbi:MAG: Ethanolamine utilization protein EutE [Candidatus Ozemobacter sibiricus]|uniref:Ethanolamine utilization protein EutE n=1 Tax=Candidatus Ozemobacter sibiricus TaxID=2268124 RepID=A0A367ZUR2_9BACT|nr:MAG: Ethanolamine utilization protein EutE [Candidatus Ozemobacter sibiricus]
MAVTRDEMNVIVQEVLKALQASGASLAVASPAGPGGTTGQRGLFEAVEDAIRAAGQAQKKLVELPLKTRAALIANMRKRAAERVEDLARLAHEETGYGRVADKIQKNMLAITKTPGLEDLQPVAYSGDHGLTVVEQAPYGVIGAITPSTNPSETVICNAIGMIAAGNAVVFGPHPAAARVSQLAVSILNDAVVEAGGPENLMTTVLKPSVQTAQVLMTHPDIRLLVVTGGPAVVAAAAKSGKKYIAAGPGNPPAVVDETADLRKAARDIVSGATLDNNVLCIAEKEIIVVEKVADELKKYLCQSGAYEASAREILQLEKVVLDPKTHGPHRGFVGRNANVILDAIGVKVPDDIRMVLCEVGPDHPFVLEEMLMPVVPLVRVRDVHAAIDLAVKVEHGYHHTAIMHSKNLDNLHKMATRCNCSIFVKNGPSYAGLGLGGEGFTTFTIASPTGEGLTSARTFTRQRRCVLVDAFRIV